MYMRTKAKSAFGAVFQLIIWVVVILFFAYITYFNVQKMQVIEREKLEIQDEIEAANKKTQELNQASEYIETDEFVEKVAREQLGLVMPDEIIFIKR